uniref:CACTA en-spm transposon protein n=1 Tax=Cucumis melo TaxID=3656 RepID=A0A9I9E577_CUCME
MNWIPARRLSENPIKSKPYLSSKQTNPNPSSYFIFWYKFHSVNPNQTNPHKNGGCKYPINNSSPCFFGLKQWQILFTLHLSLSKHNNSFFHQRIQLCKISTKALSYLIFNRKCLTGYEVEYPSWNIDAIFQRTTCGVEVGYTMESVFSYLISMDRFVEHQVLSTFKEFRDDCHIHFKKYSYLEETHANPPPHILSNHGPTRLLDISSLTIIVAGRSCFYNDNMSSLSKERSQSIVWSCFDKHTFEMGLSYRRPQRIHIPSLPPRVLSHSLRTRYARLCWVDDHGTQKTLVRDQSPRLARRLVRAMPRPRVCNPR